MLKPVKEKSLFFAPMEGITDEAYRLAVMKCFPEWDYFATDFLRVPTEGRYTNNHILEHFGPSVFADETLRNKTIFQILTTPRAQTERTVGQIHDLGFEWLDLNLGCPSKRVNAHLGGAYLMSDLAALKNVIQTVRKSFPKRFTAKIRVGYRDDTDFVESLKILEGEGVEMITVHGRTRDQLYKGVANWDYIKTAAQTVSVPVVANGDIWTLEDLVKIYEHTNCHSVMMARGALKTPWIAGLLKDSYTDRELLTIRAENIQVYLESLEWEFRNHGQPENFITRRFKAFSRNLFDDFTDGEIVKKHILRSKSLVELKDHIRTLPC